MSSVKKGRYGYRKTIKFEVFSKGVVVAFVNDLTEYAKAIFDNPPDMYDTAAATMKNTPDTGNRMIIFKLVTIWKPYELADQIAHESYHAIVGMLKHLGMELENEVVAYHLGHLVGEITKFAAKVKEAESTAPMVLNNNAVQPKG
jgi:hypothetical protein